MAAVGFEQACWALRPPHRYWAASVVFARPLISSLPRVILSSLGLRFKRWHYLQQLHETKPPDHAITQEASAELFITATETMLEQTNKSSQKTDEREKAADRSGQVIEISIRYHPVREGSGVFYTASL